MSEPAVLFDGVWKKFRRGERLKARALRDVIPALARRTFRREPKPELTTREFWAVKNVSFEVRPGEALGIIGHNGAGKSTTLKLLTKILKPTRGRAKVNGRMGALIELVAGFHPDLTGRENVFLQGAIMGMKRAETFRKLDDIVEFAGVRDFIDTPVKRYSSGMQARLGFSIAAHLDPQVLLIDEVLAVGDMRFQERCFERMQGFKKAGVAIVFVSHNLSAVSSLCDTVVVLKHGEVHTHAPTDQAIAAYASLLQEGTAVDAEAGSAAAVVELLNATGQPVRDVRAGDEVFVHATISGAGQHSALTSVLRVRRLDTGDVLFATSSVSVGCPPVDARQGDTVTFRWRLNANLSRGHYSLEFVLNSAKLKRPLVRLNPAVLFGVHEHESQLGVVYLAASCTASAGIPEPAAVHG